MAAYRLSFGAALMAGGMNVVFGLVLAWVLHALRFSGTPAHRRGHRSAFRLADGGGRNRAHHPVRRAGVAGAISRAARDQGGLRAGRGGGGDGFRRAAVRGPDGPAGVDGSRPAHGGGRRDAGGLAPLHAAQAWGSSRTALPAARSPGSRWPSPARWVEYGSVWSSSRATCPGRTGDRPAVESLLAGAVRLRGRAPRRWR